MSKKSSDTYKLPLLMDVNNIPELVAYICFLVISILLMIKVYKNLVNIKNLQLSRAEEQKDMLLIQKLLLINLTFEIISYSIEIVGYPFLDSESDIFPISYYFFSYSHIVVLYIAYWRSSLIWIQLLSMKQTDDTVLKNIYICLKRFPIIEILIIILAILMFVFYLLKKSTLAGLLFFFITCFILFIFIIVGILFRIYVLTQKDIPKDSRLRVQIYILILIIVIMFRLIWNFLNILPNFQEVLKDFKYQHNSDGTLEEHPFNWTIYIIIYIPLANFVPIFLLTNIYQPKSLNLHKKKTLIDISF
ncbi:unnamed protein product [Paramecium primaurelia]|uniref:Uncharacterized protein n=1 Tax=Paramecium primaurelia TaxID=5886 RepID=A0A8S1K6X5_PARPR|nr:unnamed protein product [Paramecium primaurelia]